MVVNDNKKDEQVINSFDEHTIWDTPVKFRSNSCRKRKLSPSLPEHN